MPMTFKAIRRRAFSRKCLFLTNLALSFLLTGTGDILAQYSQIFRGNLKNWDQIRTSEMAVAGVPIGAYCHGYYKILDRWFPGTSTKAVVKKVILDQTFFGPIGILIFITTITCVQSLTIDDYIQNVEQNWWTLIKAELVVWTPAQFFNYYVIPPKYRVLYDNIISLGCHVYKSYVYYDS